MLLSDIIYGIIELHPCLTRIIDTPQFQRLRGLKQLGAVSWVYPSATHTRFEHSIGVSYLATRFLNALRAVQSELNITQNDIICVSIGGLCHDLGHGPFSHAFDGEFIKESTWRHEDGSADMLKWLLINNQINLEEYGLTITDMIFINELILGSNDKVGRPPEKAFLYDIINNERSGLDVDKLDYLVRDIRMTGIGIGAGISSEQIVHMARVLPDEFGVLTICFPDKYVGSIFGIFHARALLHAELYQNSNVKTIEYMLCDILRLANPFLPFRSEQTGKDVLIMDSIYDMSVFMRLRDSIIDIIEISNDIRMKPAQDLLTRMRKRDLYILCGTANMNSCVENASEEIACVIEPHLHMDDFIVETAHVHHGKGTTNPIDCIRFYSKNDLIKTCFKISEDHCLGTVMPKQMSAYVTRVYAKKQAHVSSLTLAFHSWVNKQYMNNIY